MKKSSLSVEPLQTSSLTTNGFKQGDILSPILFHMHCIYRWCDNGVRHSWL